MPCSTTRSPISWSYARSVQGAGRAAADRLDLDARQERRRQSRALQLLQCRLRRPAFRDVRLRRPQGQPAQRRGDRRVRLLARHLRSARSDEPHLGRGRTATRRDAAGGAYARAVAIGGAAAREGIAGRVRMPLLADHRAAGAGRLPSDMLSCSAKSLACTSPTKRSSTARSMSPGSSRSPGWLRRLCGDRRIFTPPRPEPINEAGVGASVGHGLRRPSSLGHFGERQHRCQRCRSSRPIDPWDPCFFPRAGTLSRLGIYSLARR